MWGTILGIGARAAGTEGLTAASVKSAAKSVAVEKIKEAGRAAPGALFNAAGGNNIPLLRHTVGLLKDIRERAKSDSKLTPDEESEKTNEKLKRRQDKTEAAKAKRERDEDKNARRQDEAEREGLKHQADVSTSTLKIISSDIHDIKEYILSPKKEDEKKEGLLGKLFSGLAGIITMIPGAAAALAAGAAAGLAKVTAAFRGLGGLIPKIAPKAVQAAAAGAPKVAASAAGIVGKAAGLAGKTPGAKLLGRAAGPLGIGLAGVDMAKNGVGVGNSMDMAASGMIMAPSPHTNALGAGMLAGRFLGDMLGINDEENTAKSNLKKSQEALARNEKRNAERRAAHQSSLVPATPSMGSVITPPSTDSATGSLVAQTTKGVPTMAAAKLPAPPSLSSAHTDLNGKSAVELLSTLVKAATTPDEGIYVKNGVKIIQSKSEASKKPSFDNVNGSSSSSELAVPVRAGSSGYTETEMAVMSRAEDAGRKAGITPVDMPDRLGRVLPSSVSSLPSTNPGVGRGGAGAFKFGGGYDEAIAEAAQKYGIREDVLRGMIKQEAGWTGKVSPTGYYGAGQFRKAAWDDVVNSPEGRAAGIPALTKAQDLETAKYRGKKLPSDVAKRDPRTDARNSVMATAILAKINARRLGKNVGEMSGEEIYLAHNMGAGGLKKLQAGTASQRDIMANTGGKAMSSREFLEWQSRNFNRNASAANRGWDFSSGDRNSLAAANTNKASAIPPMLRAPKSNQGEAVYAANKKADAKASAPIVVQGGPTIVQGGGGKSRNSARGASGAQTAMVTRNPDPAIRSTILGWLQRAV